MFGGGGGGGVDTVADMADNNDEARVVVPLPRLRFAAGAPMAIDALGFFTTLPLLVM